MFTNFLSVSVIGAAHLLGMLLRNFYVFIVPTSVISSAPMLDYAYLALFFIIPISWLFFGGECPITYFAKKLEDPNYVMGSAPKDIKDIKDLFPPSKQKYYRTFMRLNDVFYAVSLFLVNARTFQIPNTTFMAIIMVGFLARDLIPAFFAEAAAAQNKTIEVNGENNETIEVNNETGAEAMTSFVVPKEGEDGRKKNVP